MDLVPGLPEELGFECLIRLPYTSHQAASEVCHQWCTLLQSQDFYSHRKQRGYTHKVACLVQSLLHTSSATEGQKPTGSPSYAISVFDPSESDMGARKLNSIPKYPNGPPLFCQLASSEGKLIMMGGWNPVSYDPVKDVFIYDFTSKQWRQGHDMPACKRSFFAIGAIFGKVYVAGGHDENKNALKSAWAYDVRRDEWSELTRMSQERDECEGVVFGNEFWVVSGYDTENQGRFEASAELYDPRTGQWKRVERVWKAGQCPRSCVGVGNDGKLVCWSESDSEGCGVRLGGQALVTGSAYQDAPQRFFMVEMNGGQKGKLMGLDVPNEFCGFVQSCCCVEI